MTTIASDYWSAPPRIGRRGYPSLLHFVPVACGGMSVRRITRALLSGEYAYSGQLDDFWTQGDLLCHRTLEWPWETEARIYLVSLTPPLQRWFDLRGHDLDRLRLALTIRDPRDSIVSLFHLTKDPVHSGFAVGRQIQDQYESDLRRVEAMSLDQYVLERFAGLLDNLRQMRTMAKRLRPHNVCNLSYAQLCLDFPTFLLRLIDFLQIDPAPDTICRLLETEDVRYKERLNAKSLSHCINAAPMPGRHRRELAPATIEQITHEAKDVLHWLAEIDAPQYASIYLDGAST